MKNKSLLISKKEFSEYIFSGQFYIIAVAFLIVTGWAFVSKLFLANVSTLRPIFNILPYIVMIFIPLLTMGSFAYEKETGTIESLLTMPFKDFQLILGKFIGITVVFILSILPTAIYAITINILGNPDVGQMISGYIGVLFLGMAFISAGLFGSTITDSQITGFIISFIIIFSSIFVGSLEAIFPGWLGGLFAYLSVMDHYSSMVNGLIDTRDLIYFSSYIIFFLYLVKVSLESRKW